MLLDWVIAATQAVTAMTRSNAQRHGMVMWDEFVAEMSKVFPDATLDRMRVDAMTMHMVKNPKSVAANLHADILPDLPDLPGSLGVAGTGKIDPGHRFPSMSEPIHGPAFDITGKGIANPVAPFWTAAQMPEHLGESKAIEQGAEGVMTPSAGAAATLPQVAPAICEPIHGADP